MFGYCRKCRVSGQKTSHHLHHRHHHHHHDSHHHQQPENVLIIITCIFNITIVHLSGSLSLGRHSFLVRSATPAMALLTGRWKWAPCLHLETVHTRNAAHQSERIIAFVRQTEPFHRRCSNPGPDARLHGCSVAIVTKAVLRVHRATSLQCPHHAGSQHANSISV